MYYCSIAPHLGSDRIRGQFDTKYGKMYIIFNSFLGKQIYSLQGGIISYLREISVKSQYSNSPCVVY